VKDGKRLLPTDLRQAGTLAGTPAPEHRASSAE